MESILLRSVACEVPSSNRLITASAATAAVTTEQKRQPKSSKTQSKMNAKLCIAYVVALVLLIEKSFALPPNVKTVETSQDANDLDRRATWLDTRNLEENFKELVYLSIQELVSEGKLNQQMITDRLPAEKRGRHQGFCFKKTKSGRFLPYICWKGDSEQEEK